MEHGMNCPHHADKDEACTCALTERTMHAAWRKRAEEAETRIAALEAQVKALTEERDAQAEAVRKEGCFFCRDCDAVRCDTEIMSKLRKIAEQAGKRQWWNVMVYIIELNGVALAEMHEAVNANPIARAAVEGGKRED